MLRKYPGKVKGFWTGRLPLFKKRALGLGLGIFQFWNPLLTEEGVCVLSAFISSYSEINLVPFVLS